MRGRGIAALGIGLGLAGLAGLTVIMLDETRTEPSPLAMGRAFFVFLQAAPFLLALLAFRARSHAVRGGIWVGAGIVAVVLPVVTFSLSVVLYAVPGGIVLIVAGATAHSGLDARRFVAAIAGVVVVGAIAAGSMFLLRNAHCWYRTGDQWVERPYSNRISFNSAQVAGGQRFSEGTCGSAPSALGYGIGAGTWALAGTATLVVGGRTRTPEPVPA